MDDKYILKQAAEICEWCEYILNGDRMIESASRSTTPIQWTHYNGNGELVDSCDAAKIWERVYQAQVDEYAVSAPDAKTTSPTLGK